MQPIQRVAIVGAGNMGSGIAQKSAQEEFDVQMVDREQQWVDRGQGIIADFLTEAIGRRIFSEQQVAEIKSRITGVVGVEATAEKYRPRLCSKTLMSKLPYSKPWIVLAAKKPYLRLIHLHSRLMN